MASSFEIQLDEAYKAEVEGKLVLFMKRLALEAFERLIMRSPVDSGRFRGAWGMAVAVRPDDVAVARKPADQGAAMTQEERDRGLRAIADLQPFQIIFITNATPYGPALENGHSQQAPQGMIAVTVAELSAHFGRASTVGDPA